MLNSKFTFLSIFLISTSLTTLSASASVQVIHDVSFPEPTTSSGQSIEKCDSNQCEKQLAANTSKSVDS